MPFFGCSACLTVCYHENKQVTRPLSQGWAPNFRLKTLAENNWMFGSKCCNVELRRRTIFPVPCALLKLAALLLSCLTHIQIGVFLNWKKNGLLLLKIYDKGNSGHARKPSSLKLKHAETEFAKDFIASNLGYVRFLVIVHSDTKRKLLIQGITYEFYRSPVSLPTFLIIIPHMVHMVIIWCCCVYIVLINTYCSPPYQRKWLVCFYHFPHPFTVFVSRVYSAFLYMFLAFIFLTIWELERFVCVYHSISHHFLTLRLI